MGGAESTGMRAVAHSGGLVVEGATRLIHEQGRTVGGVFGPLTDDEARKVLTRLRVSDDPARCAQDIPWAAVVRRSDGCVAATASTMFACGLFHLIERDAAGPRLILATDPAKVMAAAMVRPQLDMAYLRRFAAMFMPPDQTPFVGMDRLPAGDTLVWRPTDAVASRVQWCGPDTLPAPVREGPGVLAEYLETFDSVVAELAARTPSLAATVSGGLDSSFMVASLVKAAQPERVVHGYCHTPLPEAGLIPLKGWVPDDYPMAQLFADYYPGAITLERLVNTAHVHPVDAARRAFQGACWPVGGGPNMVWLNDFADRAQARGATLRFHARMGNASFSNDQAYAARYYLLRGRFAAALSLASPSRGRATSWPTGVRMRIIRPAKRKPPADPSTRYRQLGVPDDPAIVRNARNTRAAYLRWLTSRRGAAPALSNPALTPGTLRVDPYASRSIIELAASIAPRQWQTGASSRAMARTLARGRMPEEIRTRRARGAQGADAWFVVRQDPQRMIRDTNAVLASPVFDGWLNADHMAAWLSDALSMPPTGAGPAELGDWLRLVSVAEFAEWAAARW